MDVQTNLVQDRVTGRLWRTAAQHVLTPDTDDMILSGRVLATGNLVLRYAIPLHGPRHLAVVPSVFVSEQGGLLFGQRAWRFMYKNYQLYPRAEIVGLQSDGDQVQVYLKELDFGDVARVLVYEAVERTLPLAQLDAIVMAANAAIQWPQLATEIIPVDYKEN